MKMSKGSRSAAGEQLTALKYFHIRTGGIGSLPFLQVFAHVNANYRKRQGPADFTNFMNTGLNRNCKRQACVISQKVIDISDFRV
jgi:hypothetical protein